MKKKIALAVFAAFSLFCIFLLVLFPLIPAFSEWFSMGPAAFFRIVLGFFSSLFPFSLFEVLIFLFILYIIFLLFFVPITLFRKKRGKKCLRLTAFLLAVPITLFSVLDLFSLTFASSYYREGVAEHMALDTEKVEEEAVFSALENLIEIVNTSADHLAVNEKGESVPPSFSEVKTRVKKALDLFAKKNSFFQNKGYEAKTFLSSPLMTYTHISGIFGFFTGEANVNTNYPHFIVTATLSHEGSHARGTAPENECNFLAAVILMESEDPYLAYCGGVSVLGNFISVCRKLSRDRTNLLLEKLDPVYFADMAYYAEFFEPYRDSFSSKVADSANSAYLKSMGQEEGTVSYSRIIRLISAYFQKATP